MDGVSTSASASIAAKMLEVGIGDLVSSLGSLTLSVLLGFDATAALTSFMLVCIAFIHCLICCTVVASCCTTVTSSAGCVAG